MQPHQKTPAGVQPAGASEQNKQHNANDGVLGTDDESHERHIRQLGDALVTAGNAGEWTEAKRLKAEMYAAIAARSSLAAERRWTEIDAAIEVSVPTQLQPTRLFG